MGISAIPLNPEERSIDILGTNFVLGSFPDFFLTVFFVSASYFFIYGIFRALMCALGKTYDRNNRYFYLIVLVALATVLGNIGKSILVNPA